MEEIYDCVADIVEDDTDRVYNWIVENFEYSELELITENDFIKYLGLPNAKARQLATSLREAAAAPRKQLVANFSDLNESELAFSQIQEMREPKNSFKILVLSGSQMGDSSSAQAVALQLLHIDWDIVIDLDQNPSDKHSAWTAVTRIGNLKRRLENYRISNDCTVFGPRDLEACSKGHTLLWLRASTGRNKYTFKYWPVVEFIFDVLATCAIRPILLVGVMLTASDRVRTVIDKVNEWHEQTLDVSDYPLHVACLAVPEACVASMADSVEQKFFTMPLDIITSKLCSHLAEPMPSEYIRMAGHGVRTRNAAAWRGILAQVHENLGSPGSDVAMQELNIAAKTFGAELVDDHEPDPHVKHGFFRVSFTSNSTDVISGDRLLYLDFLRGSTLPWSLLALDQDLDADIPKLFCRSEFGEIRDHISNLLHRPAVEWNDTSTLVICEHDASAGATTLGRQLLRHFADKFPCFIVEDASGCAEYLAVAQRNLFMDKPLLLLLDNVADPADFDRMLHYRHPCGVKAIVLAMVRASNGSFEQVRGGPKVFSIRQLGKQDKESLEAGIKQFIADIPGLAFPSTTVTAFDVKTPFFYGLLYCGVLYSNERVQSHVDQCFDVILNEPESVQVQAAGLLSIATTLFRHADVVGIPENYAIKLASADIINTGADRSSLASAILNLLVCRHDTRDRLFVLPNEQVAQAVEQRIRHCFHISPGVLALVWFCSRLLDFDSMDQFGVNILPMSELPAKLVNVSIPIAQWLNKYQLPRTMDDEFLKIVFTGLFSRHIRHDVSEGDDSGTPENAPSSSRSQPFSTFVNELQEEHGLDMARTLFSLAAAAGGDEHVLAHYGRFLTITAEVNKNLPLMREGFNIVNKTLKNTRDPPSRLCHLGGALALRIIKHILNNTLADDSLAIVREYAESAETLLLKIGDPLRSDPESFALVVLRETWRADLRLTLHDFAASWSWYHEMSQRKFFSEEPSTSLFLDVDGMRMECLQLLDLADHFNSQTDDSGRVNRDQLIRDKFFEVLKFIVFYRQTTREKVARQLSRQLNNKAFKTFLPVLAGQILIGQHPTARQSRWRPFSDEAFQDELHATSHQLLDGISYTAAWHGTVPMMGLRDLLAINIEFGCRSPIWFQMGNAQGILDFLLTVRKALGTDQKKDPQMWTMFCAIAMAALKVAQTPTERGAAIKEVVAANDVIASLVDFSPAVQRNASATAYLFLSSAGGLSCIRDAGYVRESLDESRIEGASPSVFWNTLAYERLWRIPGKLTNGGKTGIVRFDGRAFKLRVTHLRGAPTYRNGLPVEFYPIVTAAGLVLSVATVQTTTLE